MEEITNHNVKKITRRCWTEWQSDMKTCVQFSSSVCVIFWKIEHKRFIKFIENDFNRKITITQQLTENAHIMAVQDKNL